MISLICCRRRRRSCHSNLLTLSVAGFSLREIARRHSNPTDPKAKLDSNLRWQKKFTKPQKGASIHDFHRVLRFFDPSPSLSTKFKLFVHKIAAFLDPVPPFCADVIYGSPQTSLAVLSPYGGSSLCVLLLPLLFWSGVEDIHGAMRNATPFAGQLKLISKKSDENLLLLLTDMTTIWTSFVAKRAQLCTRSFSTTCHKELCIEKAFLW